MDTTKHTPGPWTTENPEKSLGSVDSYSGVRVAQAQEVSVYDRINGSPQRIANARLIAEAGTVATETGLTPRQLAEQRKELLEAAKDAVEAIADGDAQSAINALSAAIAKATGEKW